MPFTEYKLSAVLRGHKQDIKDLAALGDRHLVSASRDGKAVVWLKEQDASWSSAISYSTDSFINSVAIVNDLDKPNHHLIASGSQSSFINLSALEDAFAAESSSTLDEPSFILIGHDKNVCAIDSLPSHNLLISGSWDTTAIVWEDNVVKYKLEGHSAAVWDAKFVTSDTFLTCSADKTIKLWQQNKLIKTFTGIHDDVIRSLVILDNDTFISASNDATIKIVNIHTGKVLKTLTGHNSFIYKIKLLNSSENEPAALVSCGEDKSVKIWDIASGKALQTIFVPSISVWSVAILPNNDIAVGGSDAIIRIFSQSSSRIDDLLHAQLLEEIQSQSINPQALNQIDSSKLSGPERLDQPGTKEGQTIMVQTPATGVINAYQWSNFTWQKIGEVLGGAGGAGANSTNLASSGKKVEHNGNYYDFVFDVDVKDGAPPLKLPFNLSENPYNAAERFLSENELPFSYVQQVVDFIMQNTQGIQLGGQPEFGAADSAAAINPYADTQSTNASAAVDKATFTTFETFKKPLLLKGIEAFNAKIGESDLSAKLSQSEISEISSLLDNVTKSNATRLYETAGKIIESGELVGFDLLRIIIGKLNYTNEINSQLLQGLSIIDGTSKELSNADVAKLIMVLRCVSNVVASSSNGDNSKKLKQIVSKEKLKTFYKSQVENNGAVKDSVKNKLLVTIEALTVNLLLV